MGNSVIRIGDGAFQGTQLTSVAIPDSVISIGDDAFQGTQLTEAVIPDSVTIIGKNAFPLVAQGQSVVTDEDKSITITFSAKSATMANGDSLTYTVVSQPSNGVLTGSAPNLTYKPNADFNGNDSFTFKANDGTTETEEATVKITITPVNDIPTIKGQEIVLNQDAAQEITFTAEDVDSEAFTFH